MEQKTRTLDPNRLKDVLASDADTIARMKQLKPYADKLPSAIAAANKALEAFDKIKQTKWPEHPDYVAAQSAMDEAHSMEQHCHTCRAELNRLQAEHPRAFGLQWLFPSERHRNNQVQQRIDALESELEQLRKMLIPPYLPIRKSPV